MSVSHPARVVPQPPIRMMEMEKLVSLCKRRGFLFQSSEIYGGLNGFWDYGPLGVELKRNVKEAWWRDMVTAHDDLAVADGRSGDLRNDRPGLHDHHASAGLEVLGPLRPVSRLDGRLPRDEAPVTATTRSAAAGSRPRDSGSSSPRWPRMTKRPTSTQAALKFFKLRSKDADQLAWDGPIVSLDNGRQISTRSLGPDAKEPGTLTEPREFNLMFKTIVGALGGEEDAAFLRPETAQGIFVNFKNVLDSTRREAPVRHRPDRQELSQRDHAAEFHLPLARIRADGNRVLLPSRQRPASGTSTGATADSSGTSNLGLAGERLRLRDHDPDELTPLFDRHGRHRIRLSVPAARASSANWKALPIAATSISAATWRESSTRKSCPLSGRAGRARQAAFIAAAART